jgi:phosphatidylglycerol lysyltransferase
MLTPPLDNRRPFLNNIIREGDAELGSTEVMKKRPPLVWIAFLATLGSGLIDIHSVASPSLPGRHSLLREFFPLEFLHLSRSLTLLIGFALVISSINIYRKKRRAFQAVLILSAASVVFHLTKGLDYEAALFSLILVVILLLSRKDFKVRSSIPDWRGAILRLATAVIVAIGYGILGFYLLDKRHFGIDFTFIDSIRHVFAFLSLAGDPDLVPLTRYARWFLDSLSLITITAIVYSLYAIFRPAIYLFRTLPHEREQAADILKRHGRSSLEFFKLWPDKSYFFSASRRSFLAYRVAANFALALADPVGPDEEIRDIIRGFAAHCEENDWRLAFHQTLPDFLPLYRELKFKKLKIGDEAIVDLGEFALEGKRMKHLRHYVNQMEKAGVQLRDEEPPNSDEILSQVKEVSDDWLKIPGRRERGFTMGTFDERSLRASPIVAAVDGAGRMQAFMNIIPSYYPGETTIDLMRHRQDAPDGIMDYLFVKLFARQREKGFTRFNLGMAPMSGFQEGENASAEERAVHFFLQRLNFLFSYTGLYQYKKKFATSWEPRYEVYQNVRDLPRLAFALSKVAAVDDDGELPDE